MPGKEFESGKSVWNLYDDKNLQDIESRVIDEVLCTHHCYMEILNDFRKFKYLERYKKRIDTQNLKEAG